MRMMNGERALAVVLAVLLLCQAGCVGLSGGGPSKEEQAAQAREAQAEKERQFRAALARADIVVLDNFGSTDSWKSEAGSGDPAAVTSAPSEAGTKAQAMCVKFQTGDKKKVVIGRDLMAEWNWSRCDAVLVTVTSKLEGVCLLSLAVQTMPGWKYAESLPVEIRPGINSDVFFRLDEPTFKSEESKWEHNQRAANLNAVRKVVFIVKSAAGGSVLFDNLRLAKFKAAAGPAPAK